MTELTIGTIIKILLGLAVVAAVGYGIYRFFGGYVYDSFKNLGFNSSVKLTLACL
jgi:hypothetical protein